VDDLERIESRPTPPPFSNAFDRGVVRHDMDTEALPVVDAWMQHPTEAFREHEMFASLRRWRATTRSPSFH
jgi:hypothetical protein